MEDFSELDFEVFKNTYAKVFNPEFVPFYPEIKKEYQLTYLQTLLYGFIRFYLTNASDKFYFTNEQLGFLFDCTEQSISNSLIILIEKEIIQAEYEIKNKGGKVRFVRLIKNPEYKKNYSHTDYKKNYSPTIKKIIVNNNKINNNKISLFNNNYIVKNLESNNNGVSTIDIYKQKSFLLNVDDVSLKEFIEKFNCNEKQIKEKAEQLFDWCESTGKSKKNYKAFLRNILRQEFGVKLSELEKKKKEIEELRKDYPNLRIIGDGFDDL